MDTSYSSYQNGNQTREQDFQKLSQSHRDKYSKISQNVSSMQRMVNQIGTHQDSPELRKQLVEKKNVKLYLESFIDVMEIEAY
ncbi:hypothetical protein NQ317_018518 [Molorchus minor]|uniref:Syntaxin N-terminal domain-containing protein n=1 Tax=Molorchus minor TaxID=1323400 RepID=A0ABQ9IRL5_9CUCU|nr:hypothetical protein NQ317_018518 [Molorchus minor]